MTMKQVWQDLGKRPLIAASLGGAERLAESARRAQNLGADLIEIRADSLKPKERANISTLIKAVKETCSLPVIVTVRSPSEQDPASKTHIDDRERKILFEDSIPAADAIDVEIRSNGFARSAVDLARRHGKKAILSYHDFKGVPSEKQLEDLLKSFENLRGDILKIAGMAKNSGDVVKMFELCKSVKRKDRIFIAMGDAGRISRVAGFLYGSAISYGYMKAPTAPGQLSVRELVDLSSLLYPSFRSAKKKKI